MAEILTVAASIIIIATAAAMLIRARQWRVYWTITVLTDTPPPDTIPAVEVGEGMWTFTRTGTATTRREAVTELRRWAEGRTVQHSSTERYA